MPRSFSMYHGGIVPCLLRIAVRRLIDAAYGRTSSYVSSGIGAREFGRWQFWQLRCRIGAMSFVNVTVPAAARGLAGAVMAAKESATTATRTAVWRMRRFYASRDVMWEWDSVCAARSRATDSESAA